MLQHIASQENGNNECAIIFLPGRGGIGVNLGLFYEEMLRTDDTLLVCVTPDRFEWYPIPNSPYDQHEAVAGLPGAVNCLEDLLQTIQEEYTLPRNRIALCGFSAGGVMAVQVALQSASPLAAVICHSGAILEPHNVTECLHPQTPIILTHTMDDYCFSWDERYVPMRDALKENHYNVVEHLQEQGGHGLYDDAVLFGANYLNHIFYGEPLNQ